MQINEYEWVKQTRETLLSFCNELNPDNFTRQLDGFGWQSIRDTLVHIVDCYHAWIGSFILLKTKKPITSKEDKARIQLEDIKVRFAKADLFVKEVLENYSAHMDEIIQREIPWREEGEVISMTPSKLLMHTITHEYHHKGQIVTMVRQMGFIPPNTDVLGTDD